MPSVAALLDSEMASASLAPPEFELQGGEGTHAVFWPSVRRIKFFAWVGSPRDEFIVRDLDRHAEIRAARRVDRGQVRLGTDVHHLAVRGIVEEVRGPSDVRAREGRVVVEVNA